VSIINDLNNDNDNSSVNFSSIPFRVMYISGIVYLVITLIEFILIYVLSMFAEESVREESIYLRGKKKEIEKLENELNSSDLNKNRTPMSQRIDSYNYDQLAMENNMRNFDNNDGLIRRDKNIHNNRYVPNNRTNYNENPSELYSTQSSYSNLDRNNIIINSSIHGNNNNNNNNNNDDNSNLHVRRIK
jgi:hypothetical protein